MNKILMLSLTMLLAVSAIGQTRTKRPPVKTIALEDYKAGNEGWLVSVDEAYEISKTTGKPILANFTGSDWCGWCKRLTKSVFIHDEFKTWAEKNVVLLELDFPRRFKLPESVTQQNRQLQQAFGVRGYPTVWVFNLNKNDTSKQYEIDALGKTGYTKTAKEFISGIEQIMANKSE